MLNHPRLFFARLNALENRRPIRRATLCALLSLSSPWLFAEELAAPVNNAVVSPVVVAPVTSVAEAISRLLASHQHAYLTRGDFTHRADDVAALYQSQHNAPLWLAGASAEKNLNDALALLENAAAHGLNAANYDAAILRQKLPAALALAPTAYQEIALYDTALSVSLLRFLHDLHYGQINPHALDFKLKLREKKLVDLPA